MQGRVLGPVVDELPSGVVTFLLTDIEGSTALWETHAAATRAALARHDAILAEAIKTYGGTLVKPKGEGDSAFAVFTTSSHAADAALAAQRALAEEVWPEDVTLRVRIAIHAGEAELRDGDYFGPTVNRAARLRELAHGGQTVLSQAAVEVLGDAVPECAELVDLGEHRLRDLSRPERVFQLVHPALPSHFPPLRSSNAHATNLPAPTTAFVGRDRHIADIAAALEAARVVTLTGVGGVGKTRLAVEVATRTLPSYRDGVWLVELAPALDPVVIIEVVAAALGVTQAQGQPLAESVLAFLRAKQLLLVLDNCEHLLDAISVLVDKIIHVCPGVRILATSREGLGVAGERIVAVPSLQLPPAHDSEAESVENSEAVRLFVTHATEARSDFALTAKNAAAVVQLCRRLDGIPLAIELAAARVRSLTPNDLAARLDERFRLLAGGPRTAVERHQTLRRAIDWSYDLLAEAEQHALNRLAVFAGTFDLDAAEAVLPNGALDVGDVIDVLSRLVDKSLVVAEDDDGETRYRLLETIRSYAQDRLEVSGELESVRGRHAAHYLAFAVEAGEGIRGPDEVTWTARLDAELDNLRAVLAWSLATEDADRALRLVAALALSGTRIGYATAGWADPVVALPDAPAHPLYPEVLAWAGCVAITGGDTDRGVRLVTEARDLADQVGLTGPSMIRVLIQSSVVAMWAGLAEDLIRDTARWLELARSIGDDFYTVGALNMTGTTALLVHCDVETARACLDEGVALARRVRNPSAMAHVANMAGECRIATEPERARELLDEALKMATSVDNRLAMGIALTFSVYLHLSLDDWPEAARRVLLVADYTHRAGDSNSLRAMGLPGAVTVLSRVGADEVAARLLGAVRNEPVADQVAQQYYAACADLQDRLGEEKVASLAAQGAAMNDDEIFALVRAEITAHLAPSS